MLVARGPPCSSRGITTSAPRPFPQAVSRLPAALRRGRAKNSDARPCPPGLLSPCLERRRAGSAWTRHQQRALAVRVRAPGNGKTVISQGIRALLDGDIAVPHSIEVEGQIIRLYDRVQHEALPMASTENGLDKGHGPDHRWVRCRRPLIMVGGELQMDQLELTYNPLEGFYRAPVQALANGAFS